MLHKLRSKAEPESPLLANVPLLQSLWDGLPPARRNALTGPFQYTHPHLSVRYPLPLPDQKDLRAEVTHLEPLIERGGSIIQELVLLPVDLALRPGGLLRISILSKLRELHSAQQAKQLDSKEASGKKKKRNRKKRDPEQEPVPQELSPQPRLPQLSQLKHEDSQAEKSAKKKKNQKKRRKRKVEAQQQDEDQARSASLEAEDGSSGEKELEDSPTERARGCSPEQSRSRRRPETDYSDLVMVPWARASKEEVESYFMARLQEAITEHVNYLSEEANKALPMRKKVFSQIESCIHSICRCEVRLYGSCGIGLALKSSDIDVGVESSFARGMGVARSLEVISQRLSREPNVVELKALLSARVPILKLRVDSGQGLVQVDVSIESESGCVTTELMKRLLDKHPELHPLTLLLKAFLAKRRLNEPYKGGLSTLPLLLLVAAFVVERRLSGKGVSLLSLLQFYGKEFDPRTTGVHLKGDFESPFFNLPIRPQGDCPLLEILHPLTLQRVSPNAFLFERVQSEMRRLGERLQLLRAGLLKRSHRGEELDLPSARVRELFDQGQ